jgi:hypothetical protein
MNCVSPSFNGIFRYGTSSTAAHERNPGLQQQRGSQKTVCLWFLSLMNVQKVDEVNVFGPFYHNVNPVCLWPKSNSQPQNNAFSPFVTTVRHQRAAEGRAAFQRRYDCTKQRILADHKVSRRQDTHNCSLAASLNIRLNTAFRKWRDVTRRVCVSAVTSSCSLNFSRTLETKDLFTCQQLNATQPSNWWRSQRLRVRPAPSSRWQQRRNELSLIQGTDLPSLFSDC